MRLVTAAGGEAILCPSISIEPVITTQQLVTIASQLQNADRAIFVSANAVPPIAPILTSHSKLIFYAVGSSTAAALKQHGIDSVEWPHDNASSEGLLALPSLQQCYSQHILIFCGENSNPLLQTTLTERGARVTCCEVYRRVPQALPPLPANVDAIICTSSEILRNFYAGLCDRDLFRQSLIVVISTKMVELAKNLGANTVLLAPNATDDAILHTLASQWSTT